MLQIVHDVAPGADLFFETGFESAGAFANTITNLSTAGCDIIVDDITYITEPFFTDGMVAQAVNQVVDDGRIYVSSAGNYGDNSYEGLFSGTVVPDGTLPNGVVGAPHDFGGGDVFQSVTLERGKYTIALHWDDDYYSLGETTNGGASNDLDIYLVDDNGNLLYNTCLLYTSPSPRDQRGSRMPSSA